MNASAKYFDPDTLARIQPLGLRARSLVEGLIAGQHRSPLKGRSIEFAQHREYTPGDDTRQVDWKVYARSDKFYLKQFEDETNLQCTLLLDISQSMSFRGPHSPLSKLEYAQLVAASLGSLILAQQDAVGLGTFTNDMETWLVPSASPTRWDDIVHALDCPAKDGTARSNIPQALTLAASRVKRRGLIVLISDLLGDANQTLSALKLLNFQRHDVLVLHTLDRSEVDFQFDRATRFIGLEGLPSIAADPRLIGSAYRKAMQSFIHTLQSGAQQMGMEYHLLVTDESLAVALAHMLARRRKATI
ncbi:MAG: DUF58 domain-containing protein [Pirellulaceae bacterium]|nr:DUF58 domain-containing protein [Pirellulaceae bacterium]